MSHFITFSVARMIRIANQSVFIQFWINTRESPELKTLEWINFNPDFLIRISTVETFHFSP